MRKLAYHEPLTFKALLVVNSLHLNALKLLFSLHEVLSRAKTVKWKCLLDYF